MRVSGGAVSIVRFHDNQSLGILLSVLVGVSSQNSPPIGKPEPIMLSVFQFYAFIIPSRNSHSFYLLFL